MGGELFRGYCSIPVRSVSVCGGHVGDGKKQIWLRSILYLELSRLGQSVGGVKIAPTWWPEVAFTEMEKKKGADFREDQGLDLEHGRVGMRGRSHPS